jgi:hypothetical protein
MVTASTETFSIHSLNLKGVLDTPSGPIALLLDPSTGASYLLRSGQVLGGPKEKPVPGVVGQIKGRSVKLSTSDNDIQELRLGEEEE